MTATTIYLDENQLRLLKHLAAEERQSDMAALIERVRRISNFPKCLAEHKLRWQGLSLTLQFPHSGCPATIGLDVVRNPPRHSVSGLAFPLAHRYT